MFKKVLLTVLITGGLAGLSLSVYSNQVLTESVINEINDEIADATAACDFKASTKYYFAGTKFYSYEMVNGVESVVEQSFDEVMPAIKEVMAECSITLESEQIISETIDISPTGQTADYVSEAIQMLRATDTKLFKSHNKGRVVYGFNHDKIVILESHYKVLAFEQVE
ncbi:hypothetical protein [Neptunicella sp. SCSIO 80796]|uniref:hypothetical protein n=1 Tax=Neptunicella plasticusilytica TaxID=3117012 RepID=UPI003A4DB954